MVRSSDRRQLVDSGNEFGGVAFKEIDRSRLRHEH
jgi:hypothetical protein